MPMKCLTDDLSAVFDDFVFGEASGTVFFNGAVVRGAIFDDMDTEVVMPDGLTEIVHQAVLTARSADFVGIAERDVIDVGEKSFRVRYWMDDGTGVITIHMVKV